MNGKATTASILPAVLLFKNLRAIQPFQAYLITKATAAKAPMLYSIGGGDGNITGIEDPNPHSRRSNESVLQKTACSTFKATKNGISTFMM